MLGRPAQSIAGRLTFFWGHLSSLPSPQKGTVLAWPPEQGFALAARK